MFKLVKYSRYISEDDPMEGQKQMEADIEKHYQLGLKPYGITSSTHSWEILYGPKD